MATQVKDAFHEAMERASVEALWESPRAQGAHGDDRASHWRWADLEPLVGQAVAATNTEMSERRVLVLIDNKKEEGMAATRNLNGALQILMPGEKARPHRHSMSALRFMMEGTGAVTIVEGKRVPMEVGDLILTPAWCWHEHEHHGKSRVVWFDGLDVPLHRHFGTLDFQPGPVKEPAKIAADEVFAAAGMVPADEAAPSYSPLFRYSYADACAALANMPKAQDGSRTLRYTSPIDGGPVMPLIDCYMTELSRGRATRTRRSTSGAVIVVADGAGESTIGPDRIRWAKNDVFTVPHKNWHSHTATSDVARLFVVSDREALRRLGILKDEVGNT
jgi:gentisate 1,2-dioxygenase